MPLEFYKYQGTGNDFIIIDNRQNQIDKNNTSFISKFCHRRFGVGADGLILLENDSETDFKMVYFNADGHQSSMCGNGGRCIVAFASFLNIIKNKCTFKAIDGVHYAEISNHVVKLQMQDVEKIDFQNSHIFLNTGSPHHVTMVENIEDYDVQTTGKKIRFGAPYYKEGTNVNFVEKESADTFIVRTYERGVEAETYSCGTGVTAVAIAMYATKKTNQNQIKIKTKGGELAVEFIEEKGVFKKIWLVGSALQVFKGVL